MPRVTYDQVYGNIHWLSFIYFKKRAAECRRRRDSYHASLYEKWAAQEKAKLRAQGWYRLRAQYLRAQKKR